MRFFLGVLVLVAVLYLMTTPTTHSARGYTIIGKPTITAQHMNNILCLARSLACGTGQSLYNGGLQAGIDPIYALAFFDHESTFGTQGVARLALSLGNIRCTPGYACIDGYRAYSTWEVGYEDWYRLMRYYVGTLHLTTVEQIVPTYAPVSENDVQGYISAVEHDVSQWRSEAQG